MKKFFFGLSALVLAVSFVTFSAFTKVKSVKDKWDAPSEYFEYKGSGAQDDIDNYLDPVTTPPDPCDLAVKLCWFRVDDKDHDNDIDIDDFDASFDALDVTNPGGNSLDDEAEITGRLEKKSN